MIKFNKLLVITSVFVIILGCLFYFSWRNIVKRDGQSVALFSAIANAIKRDTISREIIYCNKDQFTIGFYQFQTWLCPIKIDFADIDSLLKGDAYLLINDTVGLGDEFIIRSLLKNENHEYFIVDKK